MLLNVLEISRGDYFLADLPFCVWIILALSSESIWILSEFGKMTMASEMWPARSLCSGHCQIVLPLSETNPLHFEESLMARPEVLRERHFEQSEIPCP